MQINQSNHTSYGYGLATQSPLSLGGDSQSTGVRETYGSSLLEHLDNKSYQAFENTTRDFTLKEKALAAHTLDKTAAISAANQYAMTHEVDATQDLAVVYNFFENYQDVVTSDQIKHLLNTRLQNVASEEQKNFKAEAFLANFTAQLGEQRALDIRV